MSERVWDEMGENLVPVLYEIPSMFTTINVIRDLKEYKHDGSEDYEYMDECPEPFYIVDNQRILQGVVRLLEQKYEELVSSVLWRMDAFVTNRYPSHHKDNFRGMEAAWEITKHIGLEAHAHRLFYRSNNPHIRDYKNILLKFEDLLKYLTAQRTAQKILEEKKDDVKPDSSSSSKKHSLDLTKTYLPKDEVESLRDVINNTPTQTPTKDKKPGQVAFTEEFNYPKDLIDWKATMPMLQKALAESRRLRESDSYIAAKLLAEIFGTDKKLVEETMKFGDIRDFPWKTAGCFQYTTGPQFPIQLPEIDIPKEYKAEFEGCGGSTGL